MKTSTSLLLTTVIATLAVSCSHDEALQPEEKQPVVVRATTEYTEVPATRTLFGTPTLDTGGKSYSIPLTWNEDETSETIDVMGFTLTGAPYGDRSFTPFTGVADSRSEDGKSISFTANEYPETSIDKYAYFYPSGTFLPQTNNINTPGLFSTVVQKQSGNNSVAHLAAVNWMYSELAAPGEAFILKPMTAILRFDLTFPAAVTNGTLTLSSDTSSFVSQIRIMCNATTVYTEKRTAYPSQYVEIADIPEPTTNLIVYMMTGAPDGGYNTGQGGVTLTLTAEMPTEAKTYTTTLGTTKDDARFLPGKCYNFVVSEDKWSVADFI
jgi:hypothetical protein